MKQSLTLVLALAMLTLPSCRKDNTAVPSSGLEGTWRLVKHQCYCVALPLPNETLTFTATTFALNRLGPQPAPQPAPFTSGTYQRAMVALCGLPTPGPGLRLTDDQPSIGPREVLYTLRADTLVLDYGSPCDAPVDTYVRVIH